MRDLPTERIGLLLALSAGLVCGAACGNDQKTSTTPAATSVAAPARAVTDEEAAAAKAALGSDAQVWLYGEVGGEGTQQVVAIDALPGAAGAQAPSYVGGKAPQQAAAGAAEVKVSRVSILSKANGAWSEVLRVDEYLKNQNGYLRGGPAAAVAGWSLRTSVEPDRRVLHFTALAPEAAVKNGQVSVAWNAKKKLYQSLDSSGKKFLGETSSLEKSRSQLR
jgi:hypothetical protein